MIKEFNKLEELEKYYNKETNTYVFKENNVYLDLVVFNFDLDVKATINANNIKARDINARDINAWNINARDIYANDINAYNINANNISYYAVCYAYHNIKCNSIKGRRKNAKHFVLDGKLEVEENE